MFIFSFHITGIFSVCSFICSGKTFIMREYLFICQKLLNKWQVCWRMYVLHRPTPLSVKKAMQRHFQVSVFFFKLLEHYKQHTTHNLISIEREFRYIFNAVTINISSSNIQAFLFRTISSKLFRSAKLTIQIDRQKLTIQIFGL